MNRQNIMDMFLRTGGNRKSSRERITFLFMRDLTLKERAELLKQEFHYGGKGLVIDGQDYAMWFDQSGIKIAKGHTAKEGTSWTWAETTERIDALLSIGHFLPQDILDKAYPNAIRELAEQIFYMKQDMDKETFSVYFGEYHREDILCPDITDLLSGVYTEVTAALCKLLQGEEQVREMMARLTGAKDAWEKNPSIMRFRSHNPATVLSYCKNIYNEGKNLCFYEAEKGFSVPDYPVFVTEDEINSYFLFGRETSKNMKYRIYSDYHTRTEKEWIATIRNQYGVGGCTPALCDAEGSGVDYDRRGISFFRNGFGNKDTKVFLSWKKASGIIKGMIDGGCYLTKKEKEQMEDYEKEEMARKIMYFYFRLEIEAPFEVNLDDKEELGKIKDILSSPEESKSLLSRMEKDFASISYHLTDRPHKEKLLAEIREYLNGSYSVFYGFKKPEPCKRKDGFVKKEPKKELVREPVTENRQLSIFDFI